MFGEAPIAPVESPGHIPGEGGSDETITSCGRPRRSSWRRGSRTAVLLIKLEEGHVIHAPVNRPGPGAVTGGRLGSAVDAQHGDIATPRQLANHGGVAPLPFHASQAGSATTSGSAVFTSGHLEWIVGAGNDHTPGRVSRYRSTAGGGRSLQVPSRRNICAISLDGSRSTAPYALNRPPWTPCPPPMTEQIDPPRPARDRTRIWPIGYPPPRWSPPVWAENPRPAGEAAIRSISHA